VALEELVAFVGVGRAVLRERLPAGKVSSNIMMLSLVSRPSSFTAKERPGVGD
jgi:hypothetical protein